MACRHVDVATELREERADEVDAEAHALARRLGRQEGLAEAVLNAGIHTGAVVLDLHVRTPGPIEAGAHADGRGALRDRDGVLCVVEKDVKSGLDVFPLELDLAVTLEVDLNARRRVPCSPG